LCELVSEVQLCCLELCVCQCQGWTCCCAGGTSSSQMTGCATQFATWLDMSWVSFHDSWKNIDVIFDIKNNIFNLSRSACTPGQEELDASHSSCWWECIIIFFGPIELNQFVAFVSFVSIVSFIAGILSVGMRGHQWGWTMSACSIAKSSEWFLTDKGIKVWCLFPVYAPMLSCLSKSEAMTFCADHCKWMVPVNSHGLVLIKTTAMQKGS
jgi:hypothetical protein